jgi:GT2 family glycosyltransferase
VLVLYRVEARHSRTFVSLCQALAQSDLAGRFTLLVYDNSPDPSGLPQGIPVPCSYIHDPGNGGLVAAYEAALRLAEKQGTEWVLLLDQDTELTVAFVQALFHGLGEAEINPRCAALAPKLRCNNAIISPARILWGGRLSPVGKSMIGIAPWEAMALNSGTAVRVSALRTLGGFDPRFWLDYLDHWLFNRLYRTGYSLYVLDAVLSHELSVRSMRDMSVARYRNVLTAEGQFYGACKSPAENRLYCFRLIFRAARMLMHGRRALAAATLRHLGAHVRSH